MLGLKKHRAPIIIIIMLLFAVSFPYIFAAHSGGSGQVFGGFLLNPLDGNSYLAKMYEGWRGEWLFSLPYTAERGNGSFLFIYYLALGHAARWFGLPLILTFHLARLLAAALLLLALYRFYQAVLPESRQVKLAFALGAMGSGLGWLALPFGAFTPDFWVAEAYPFLSAYANPHFPLSLALILWLLTPHREPGQKPGKELILTLIASLLLAVISPFGVVIVVTCLGGVLVWEILSSFSRWLSLDSNMNHEGTKERRITKFYLNSFRSSSFVLRLPFILLGGGPLLLYDLWVSRVDPFLTVWNAQNVTTSPPLWDLIVSLSPALFLTLPAAWTVLKRYPTHGRLLLAWLALGLVLLYLPFGLQRRFMMGLYIPLAGLAAMGIDRLVHDRAAGAIHRRRYLFVVFLLFMLAVPTNLVVLLAARHGAQTHDPNLYLSSGEEQAFRWIERNTPGEALILASPQTGLFIPAHTGRRVLYGHPFETANAGAEKEFVTNFYLNGDIPDAAREERGVDYIFYGPREQEINAADFLTGLPAVYDHEGVKIYTFSGPSALDD